MIREEETDLRVLGAAEALLREAQANELTLFEALVTLKVVARRLCQLAQAPDVFRYQAIGLMKELDSPGAVVLPDAGSVEGVVLPREAAAAELPSDQ